MARRLALWALLPFIGAAQAPGGEGGENLQKISFKPPEMDEQMQESVVLHPSLRCEACQAIAYHWSTGFDKLEKRLSVGGKKPLPEFEMLEVLEEACEKKLEEYGLKSVNGENKLSGPGLAVRVRTSSRFVI